VQLALDALTLTRHPTPLRLSHLCVYEPVPVLRYSIRALYSDKEHVPVLCYSIRAPYSDKEHVPVLCYRYTERIWGMSSKLTPNGAYFSLIPSARSIVFHYIVTIQLEHVPGYITIIACPIMRSYVPGFGLR